MLLVATATVGVLIGSCTSKLATNLGAVSACFCVIFEQPQSACIQRECTAPPMAVQKNAFEDQSTTLWIYTLRLYLSHRC
jgi:hypothetical protein